MTRHTLRRVRRLAGIVLPAAAAILIGFQVRSSAQPAAGGAGASSRQGATPGSSTEDLFKLNLKFHGAQDCSNAKCHGAPGKPADSKEPPPYYDEFTAWATGKPSQDPDPHSKAYESLGGATPKGKKGDEIWAKYKPLSGAKEAKATDSAKCLTCHALAAPKAPVNEQGPKFAVDEGVTCGSCHGPYQKWGDPHSKKVGNEWWAEAERKATGNNPAAFLAKWGFYDTKNLQARADKCTSCHLAIDPQMVEAGHPQPQFELNSYSASYPSRHWRQEEGFFGVKLWAVGQAVSLRDAMGQLATRASTAGTKPESVKQAYNQAMAHYRVFSQVFAAKAVNADAGAVQNMNQWATALQAAMAGNKLPDVAKAASNISLYVIQLTPAVTQMTPNAQTTAALLQAITSQGDTVTLFGDTGADQQRSAIYALYGGLATSPNKPAGADAVLDLIISGLYPPQGKTAVDPAAYQKALNDIKAKLPK
jgi:hypothetical protein